MSQNYGQKKPHTDNTGGQLTSSGWIGLSTSCWCIMMRSVRCGTDGRGSLCVVVRLSPWVVGSVVLINRSLAGRLRVAQKEKKIFAKVARQKSACVPEVKVGSVGCELRSLSVAVGKTERMGHCTTRQAMARSDSPSARGSSLLASVPKGQRLLPFRRGV